MKYEIIIPKKENKLQKCHINELNHRPAHDNRQCTDCICWERSFKILLTKHNTSQIMLTDNKTTTNNENTVRQIINELHTWKSLILLLITFILSNKLCVNSSSIMLILINNNCRIRWRCYIRMFSCTI